MYVDHVYQHLHVLCMGKDREKALSTFRCSSWHGRGGALQANNWSRLSFGCELNSINFPISAYVACKPTY